MERSDVEATYRMLRLALAGAAVTILIAVVAQSIRQECVLGSISAYYFTPAGTVFATALVAIGIMLVALRGSTWTENLLLNLAGLLAPVVAIVPTRASGHDADCHLSAVAPGLGDLDVTLISYGAFAAVAVLLAVAFSRGRRPDVEAGPAASGVARAVGFVLPIGALVGFTAWRVHDGEQFLAHAHTAAATGMFGAIIAVVAFRTGPLSRLSRRWDLYRDDASVSLDPRGYSTVYGLIAVVMLLAVVAAFVAPSGWDYRLITVETVLLGGFIVFWLVQSVQLRTSGR